MKLSSINWQDFVSRQHGSAKSEALKAFYASQQFGADLTLADAKFVALDFETTGLDSEQDEIVSIGLVPFDLNRIYLKQAREWFVRPKGNLNHDSVVIHGITDEQVSNAPAIEELFNDLLVAISGKIVVVHYRFIEREFLYEAYLKHSSETLMFPVIDTMSIEARLHRSKFLQRLKQFIKGRGESVRLPDCRERYGLPRYKMHSAQVDALATAELLQAQVRHYFDPQTPIFDLVE